MRVFSNWFWVSMIVALFAFAGGCSSDSEDDSEDGTGGGDNPVNGCGFEGGGNDGTVSVSEGKPVTLDESTDESQNTPGDGTGGQMAPAVLRSLRYGPCGSVGLVMQVSDDTSKTLVFLDPQSGASFEEIMVDAQGPGSLFFDADCNPVVITGSFSGYMEHTRSDSGVWTENEVLADFSAVVGGAPDWVEYLAADQGRDGKFSVFAVAHMGEQTKLVYGSRASDSGAAWTFEALPSLEHSDLYDLRVDSKGVIHAVFRNTALPCNPDCNVDVKYATVSPGASSWNEEVMQVGKWGDPHDEFVGSASIAFDGTDNVYIAAFLERHVITGSYLSAELRLYGKVDGDWCSETLATQTEGYSGADGTEYTGFNPQLVIDDADHLHILFRDMALWHDGNGYENGTQGQIRYALRSGTTWTFKTIFEQDGQSDSSNPLLGVSEPTLAVSPDGNEATVTGTAWSWQTDSIYNDSPAPVTYRALSIVATLGHP